MKTLFLDCSMGAAGDMLMAALYELIQDKESFLKQMNVLIPGVTVERLDSKKCGILGSHMEVRIGGKEEESEDVHAHHGMEEGGHSHDHHGMEGAGHSHEHHSMEEVWAVIDRMEIAQEVKDKVKEVYERIANAESKVHGSPVTQIHFHEVGSLDAILDITGVCLLLHQLKPDRIAASPVNVGSGSVRCAHGILPVPVPAAAELLQGVPTYMSEIQGELCTPTGAALLKTFVGEFGPMPAMMVQKTGYGMGKKDFPRANCVRAFWGESCEEGAGTMPNQRIVELCTNVDDMTPEQLGFAMEKLLKAGARDVFFTPIQMKKNRPGVLLTCICLEEEADSLAKDILSCTTTFGVRKRLCDRYALDVSFTEKETPWGIVHIKSGEGYGIRKSKPEYEDVAAIMRKTGKNWQEVMEMMKE